MLFAEIVGVQSTRYDDVRHCRQIFLETVA